MKSESMESVITENWLPLCSYCEKDRMTGYELMDAGLNPGTSALVPWSKG